MPKEAETACMGCTSCLPNMSAAGQNGRAWAMASAAGLKRSETLAERLCVCPNRRPRGTDDAPARVR